MWYQDSVTFSVGATSSSTPSASPGLRGPRAERAGDEAVGVERHVRPVLLGRPDRDQHRVHAPPDRRLDLRPGHPLDEPFRSPGAIFDECQTSCNTRPSPSRGGMDGRTGAGQRRRALVPGDRRGRARRPDPRCRLRPLQLRARDAGPRGAVQGRSTTTCAATGSPTARSRTTTWRSGPTTSPACSTRSTSRRPTCTARRWAG